MGLKKNASHSYIGLVVNSTVEIYKIIHVEKHVLFNVTFIELALHTHTARKLKRFFKSIAFWCRYFF
jgi:hypothetical protein